MEKYDIIIVGSGLGGLVCGSILSKNGYKVLVLEKNIQIGGCLQSFKRNGVKFETGMIQCKDDETVDYRNAEVFHKALNQAKVQNYYKLYPTGNHGAKVFLNSKMMLLYNYIIQVIVHSNQL